MYATTDVLSDLTMVRSEHENIVATEILEEVFQSQKYRQFMAIYVP